MDLLWKVLLFTVPFAFLYDYIFEVYRAKSKGEYVGGFLDGLLLMLTDMKSFLDFLRMTIIYTAWALILAILFRNDTNWIWILVWAIGGLILVVNLAGFITLPLYAALGYKNAKDWKNKARFPNVYEDEN